jgi:hypothetical protein
LGGFQVTGLEASTDHRDTVWVGLDGPPNTYYYSLSSPSFFSAKGLRRFDGQTWTSYRSANSVLPSDTLYSVVSRGSDSLWITCDSGLYEFIPPSKLTKVANPVSFPTTSMAWDTQNHLYIGTPSGVYELENDSLVALNYPVVSLLAQNQNMTRKTPQLQVLMGPANPGISVRSLLGQRVNSNPAPGVYVTRPSSASFH